MSRAARSGERVRVGAQGRLVPAPAALLAPYVMDAAGHIEAARRDAPRSPLARATWSSLAARDEGAFFDVTSTWHRKRDGALPGR